ncbi:MAG: aminotransferase class I/II-fold pyridoxal phosphate-dependent enzyme, partial [Acidobacteria bacterium]|nr:aminotransferase class I/II-fold pyridoxal phosphate-dependent enzyme [Acidobacteriota bacterium]
MTTATSAFRLAARLDEVGFSDIVKIRNQIMKLREAGEQVFQFEGGEPFLDTPAHVKEAMTRALAENRTRYAPSSGVPELRAAIAEKLRTRNRLPAGGRDVIVLSGGMHGLFGAFQSVVNPGDEVLLFSPYWTPIKDLVSYCGGRAVFVPTDEARREGFAETLARHTTVRTRALYFNTPQNPSGLVFTRAEAEAVAAFVRDRDLAVVADEAYEDLIYDGEHVSIASLEGMFERTITCYTLSKSFSMTGWRIGYAAAAEPWMTGLRKTTLYSTNGVSTPTQWAALAAVISPADFFEGARAEYRRRRDLLVSGLNEIGLACEPPAGAFYAFPDCARIDPDSRTAADQLLERARVSTVPGAVFGPHGEGRLRFSFSTSIETI